MLASQTDFLCVYNAMRSAFPTGENQYHGYEEEDENE